jgi:hypothetical protein
MADKGIVDVISGQANIGPSTFRLLLVFYALTESKTRTIDTARGERVGRMAMDCAGPKAGPPSLPKAALEL